MSRRRKTENTAALWPGRKRSWPNTRCKASLASESVASAIPKDDPNFESKLEKKTKAPSNFFRFVVLCYDKNTGKLRWEKTAAEIFYK